MVGAMRKVRVRAEVFKAEKKAENKLQSKDIQEDTCPPRSAPPTLRQVQCSLLQGRRANLSAGQFMEEK